MPVPRSGGARLLALLSRFDPSVREFVFAGSHLAAIRQESWVAADFEDEEVCRLRAHVAGRLLCNGDVFVVFSSEAPEAAVAEQCIAQRLTQRELKVGCMIAEGLTDKQIARRLGISAYTVREHCRRACAKLGISRRSALVRCLFTTRLGGLDPEDQD
ncbi:helix-turn-helix transcriptional regulator [Amaricoccus solimangrovi]|uniref:Helix-turn-helix transcriptional regulator n=2 Tax=Amaricoccus solimangrovi TaxID=2589815 RepID=A0A501WYI6_9RHOB|nr:helix-turn-helix transcriptional regulator [Amaricoccus solimangrovi]